MKLHSQKRMKKNEKEDIQWEKTAPKIDVSRINWLRQ
jgi:hypothetical protein